MSCCENFSLTCPNSETPETNIRKRAATEMQKEYIDRIHHYVDSYNRFDIEGMMEQLHPDVVFRNYLNGALSLETRGASEFRAQAEAAAEMFSQRNQTLKAVSAQHATLVAEIDYVGTVSKDLPNGLQAGEKIELSGVSEFTFLDGKIASIVDRS